jgi:polyvinyl alcohol dehydrogenase (cytochrome)
VTAVRCGFLSGGFVGLFATLFALGLAVPPQATADWPLYGHDIANTRDGGTEGPVPADVPTLDRAWRFTSSSDFTGTPVVADGLVVAGDFAGHVYAIDAVSGDLRWKHDLAQPINGSAAIDLHAPSGPTVYIPLQQVGSPRVAALSLRDGKVLWKTVLTHQPTSSVYGSPAVWKHNLYIGTSGPNGDNSTARGTVVSLKGATGAVRWRAYTVPPGDDGGAVWSTPAIDPATGTLYVGTGNAYHAPAANTTDAVLALDAATGQVLAHYQATPGDVFGADNPLGTDADFGASPNLFESSSGQKLVGMGAKDGNYYALDRPSLDLAWRTSIGPGSAIGGFLGSTAFDGTRIYGSDALTSQVSAIDRDGAISWSSSDGGSLDFSPLTVANGVLYTANQAGFLTARDAQTGTTLTRLQLGGPTFGGISATGRALYAAVGIGPPPQPGPQQAGSGSIVAFGDTSVSGGSPGGGGAKKLRFRVRPRHVVAGRITRFHFRTRAHSRPVARTRIRLAKRHVRSDRRGRAEIIAALRHGKHRVRARKPGFQRATATVVARRRSR